MDTALANESLSKTNAAVPAWARSLVWTARFSPGGLCGLTFNPSSDTHESRFVAAGTAPIGRTELNDKARLVEKLLRERLSGKRVDIPWQEFDLSGHSEFHVRIWKTMHAIPFGEIRTYAEIARAAGSPKAFRACGHACGANPIVLFIPCHRVVGSTGLGGFSSGLEWKKRFLTSEGVDWSRL